MEDSRFSHILSDPRFKRIPKLEKKIKIDKRFQSMFKDKNFKVNYTVDKRGRPIVSKSNEDLKKFYSLSSDDESGSDDDGDDENDDDCNHDDTSEDIEIKDHTDLSKSSKQEKLEESEKSVRRNNKAVFEKIKKKKTHTFKVDTDLKDSDQYSLSSDDESGSDDDDGGDDENDDDTSEDDEIKDHTYLSKSSKQEKSEESEKRVRRHNKAVVEKIKKKKPHTSKVDTDLTDSDQYSTDNKESSAKSDKVQKRKVLSEEVKNKLRNLTVDYARGEGVLFSDSSSDEESSDTESEEEELLHEWGELDHDAEKTEDITNRLAVCHMDWDRIRAIDLMVLFNSFLPQGGIIHSVTIYPSEFGMKRMQEEEVKGPIELVERNDDTKNTNEDEGEEEDEEGRAYSREKLRKYQLTRLKYYYAVLVCDSPQTANKIYTDCEGMEYESSASRLDLRFIPDDITFDQEPREVCNKLPDLSKYLPRYFTTTALQQVKVDLTWDETKPERKEINQKLMSGNVDGVTDADLQDYLAVSSEDESNDEAVIKTEHIETNESTDDPLSKYRSLLKEIEEQEEKKKSRDVEMEITWGVGLKDKAEKLVEKKLKEKEDLTPFEKYLEKRKEKRKQKRIEKEKQKKNDDSSNEYSDDDIPSDIDMNDPYFQEEFTGEFKKKDKKTKKKAIESTEEITQEQAQLELLLMNDPEEKRHFSLKSIQEKESQEKHGKKKLKYKRKMKLKSMEDDRDDDFQINVEDERFSALFSSHHFNIDPTDPHYRKTKAMEALKTEKINRRQNEEADINDVVPAKMKKVDKTHKKDPELSLLVKNIKRKTQNLHKGGR